MPDFLPARVRAVALQGRLKHMAAAQVAKTHIALSRQGRGIANAEQLDHFEANERTYNKLAPAYVAISYEHGAFLGDKGSGLTSQLKFEFKIICSRWVLNQPQAMKGGGRVPQIQVPLYRPATVLSILRGIVSRASRFAANAMHLNCGILTVVAILVISTSKSNAPFRERALKILRT